MSREETQTYINGRQGSCLSLWFPVIAAAGVPVPKTTIIKTDIHLWSMLDGERPAGFDAFLAELGDAAAAMGYPCFLRTGQGSGKHDWLNTCYLPNRESLACHIYRLVEWSELVDIMGLPYDVWVVREMLPTEPAFTAFYNGLPVTKERRYFVRDGVVEEHYPYWPVEAFEDSQPSVSDWRERLAAISIESPVEVDYLTRFSECVGEALPGYWSVDWLWTKRGWYLTDMAAGDVSWKPGIRG